MAGRAMGVRMKDEERALHGQMMIMGYKMKTVIILSIVWFRSKKEDNSRTGKPLASLARKST